MSEGRTNPQSLGYIIEACDQWEKATRARAADSEEISRALNEVDAIRKNLKALCLALKGNCDPASDHICPGRPKR